MSNWKLWCLEQCI